MRKERGKQIPEKSFISRTVLILLVCAALLLGGCASGSGNGTVDQNSRGQDSPGTEAAEGTGNGMDTYYFMWMDVGCAYFEPLIDYDIYADAARYESDVLILQDDADSIVPQSVAERAAQEYPSAELKILPGAGHGFSGEHRQQAVEYILEYLNTHRTGAEGKQIRMTAGDVEVLITLNDSQAAADLYRKLPLEMELIERNDFAKGMTLPERLDTEEETTREYEIGDFGYWEGGPDLAIFYDDIYDQTVVPVIPLGKAVEGAEAMRNTSGTVRLEAV